MGGMSNKGTAIVKNEIPPSLCSVRDDNIGDAVRDDKGGGGGQK